MNLLILVISSRSPGIKTSEVEHIEFAMLVKQALILVEYQGNFIHVCKVLQNVQTSLHIAIILAKIIRRIVTNFTIWFLIT